MAATQNRDMGSGSIPKLLAQLALPAVVAQVVNLLYNIVDRIYIGHMPEVGASALTGVGLFTPILMLITAFAMLCGSGGAPRAAIAMGRGDDDAAEKIMGNCFTLLLILAAVLTVVFYFAAPSLLVLFGASEKTLPYALDYARIYIIGTIFVLIVMGMNPFVTTQGFATFSMMTTVIGAVCNIILDPILIFALNMGVRGAATATVISQAVGAVWVLRFLTGRQPHQAAPEREKHAAGGKSHRPLPWAGRFHLCDDCHRKYPFHQLQLQPGTLWRRYRRRRHDHHHQRHPAAQHAGAGALPGRTAHHEL